MGSSKFWRKLIPGKESEDARKIDFGEEKPTLLASSRLCGSKYENAPSPQDGRLSA